MTSDVCHCVCLCVRTLKGKMLELLTKLVDIQCMAIAQHALILKSKSQVRWLLNTLASCLGVHVGRAVSSWLTARVDRG